MKIFPPLITFGLLLSTSSITALAEKNKPSLDYFDAAICKPPYSFSHASNLYDMAEKLGKPDLTSGAAVYHLSTPIKKDGLVAQDVLFSGSTVGVLVEGDIAEKLAKQYNLAPQEFNIINMSGFARQLPSAQQQLRELGLISIVALSSSAFKNKTLLACQFVSNEDRKNMKMLNGK